MTTHHDLENPPAYSEPDTPRPTQKRASTTSAEWFPASDERLRVATAITWPRADAERALRVQPDRLVRRAYGTDLSSTDAAVISLTPFSTHKWLRVPARIELCTPNSKESEALISIRWRATHLARYFPVLTADLSLHGGKDMSSLVLDGTYRPPLGLTGLIFDHLVGKRLARAVAVGFIEALRGAIESDELSDAEEH